MNLILSIGLSSFWLIFILVFLYKDTDTHLKRDIIKNRYQYDGLTFDFNGALVNITFKTTNITPTTIYPSYNNISEIVVFINENPILSIWEMSTLINRSVIIKNKAYKFTNIRKVLKAAKKAYWKRLCKTVENETSKLKSII
jgi:hypothetical protein